MHYEAAGNFEVVRPSRYQHALASTFWPTMQSLMGSWLPANEQKENSHDEDKYDFS
jgi:hypothetical protein